MSVIFKDRTAQTSTTTGTGSYSLNGSITGFQDFDCVGNGNECFYAARCDGDWEVGRGTVTVGVPNTLTRDEIYDSSDDGDPIDWPSGTKSIALVVPAQVMQGAGFSLGDTRFHGADITGVLDSSEACQDASDADYDVRFFGTTRIEAAITGRSHVRYSGEGNGTLLFNDQSIPASGVDQVFWLGTVDDGGLTDANAVASNLNAVTKGDDHVTCTTPAVAGNYEIGDIVAIYGGTGYTAGGLYHKPTHQQLNEVVSVNASTGVIELRDPIYRTTATGMKIHCMRHNLGHLATDHDPQMVGYVTVENMRVGSELDAISRYGGIYRGTFRNLQYTDTSNVWSMNATAHCNVQNIQAVIRNRGIEFAYFCHDNYIQNIDMVQETGTATAQDLGMVSFSEGCHHNTVVDVRADYHDATTERCVRFAEGSYMNRVTRMKARAPELAFVVTLGHAETTMDIGGNVLEDSVFEVGTVSGDVISVLGVTDATSVDLTIRRCKFKIDTIGAVLIDIDASDVALEYNDFSQCPADAINVDTACTGIRFIGNKFPSGTALTVFAQANVFARDNSIVGREAVETMNLVYGDGTAITSTSATNALDSQAVPAAGFAAGDELIVDIGAVGTGAHDKTIDITWDGDVICTFTTTTAEEYRISGRIRLNTASAWKAVTWQSIGTSGDTVRKATTSDTAAISGNGLLEIRAYVGNAASSIIIDYASVKWVPRY